MRLKKLFSFGLIATLLFSQSAFAWRAFGGGFKEQVSAADIETDTSNFNGLLSSTDDNVQDALDTLDNILSTLSATYARLDMSNTTFDPEANSTRRFVWDFTDSAWLSVSGPVISFLDNIVSGSGGLSPGNPRTFIDAIGGIHTISYIKISGSFSGTGTSFRLGDPFVQNTQPYMLGIRSDISDAAFQLNCSNFDGTSTAGYIFLGGRFTSQATIAINHDGRIYWSAGHTPTANTLPSADANFDTYIGRVGGLVYISPSLSVDVDLTVGAGGGGGTLTVADGVVASSASTAISQFGEAPPATITSFTTAGDRLGVVKSNTATSGAVRAGNFVSYWAGTSAASSGSSVANAGFAGTSGATQNLTSTSQGGGLKVYRGVVDINDAITVTQGSVLTGGLRLDTTATITDFSFINSEGVVNGSVSSNINRYSDLWVRDGTASNGTFSTRIGIRIDQLTRAANNYAMFIGGTGLASGIYWNSTTTASKESIYSSASGLLTLTATTSIESLINGAVEVTLSANNLTFNSGSADPVIDWTTDGILDVTTGTWKLSGGGTTRSPLNITASAAPSSPNAGDVWHDKTQKAVQGQLAGVEQTVSTIIFTSTARASTSGTGESTIIGSGVGTTTLPANFFVAGKTIRVIVYGNFDSTGGSTATIKLKLGSTELTSVTTSSYVATAANFFMKHEFLITCRSTGASGTVFAQGYTLCPSSATTIIGAFNTETATTTIDTTASQVIDVVASAAGGGTGSIVHGDNTVIEVLN